MLKSWNKLSKTKVLPYEPYKKAVIDTKNSDPGWSDIFIKEIHWVTQYYE